MLCLSEIDPGRTKLYFGLPSIHSAWKQRAIVHHDSYDDGVIEESHVCPSIHLGKLLTREHQR